MAGRQRSCAGALTRCGAGRRAAWWAAGRVARSRVTACGTGAPRLAGSASAVGARGATARLGVAAGSGSAAQGRPDPSLPSRPRTQMRMREKPRRHAEKGETEKENGSSFYGLKRVLKKIWAKI
jgi:hypothetical protein